MDWGKNSHLDDAGRPKIIERRFTVDPESAGLRLDLFLKRRIPRLSRNRLQGLIRTNLSDSTGATLKPNHRVCSGDQLLLRIEARPEPPCPRTFTVLFEDNSVMVVDKPAGLPVHASAKFYFNTLTRVLFERFPENPPQVCHRLDRETSGCLIVAKNRDAARHLKQCFQYKRATKHYLAIVHGTPPWQERSVDLPLGLRGPCGPGEIDIRMVVRDDAPPARTQLRCLQVRNGFALLQCTPITGRQHQIRAHLAAIQFPIVGDKLYAHGDETFIEYCAEGLTPSLEDKLLLPRHALHAHRIQMPHPVAGTVDVTSPLPQDLVDFFAQESTAMPPFFYDAIE